MAEQKSKPEVESVESAPAADEASEKYPREHYIDDAQQLVGHPAHVVAGALAELDTKSKTLTPQQVKKAVEQHLDREVEVEEA